MFEITQLFSLPLLAWYNQHGRKDLPWQLPRSPYRVWISEIMLQQTQVQTVIPYFNRFISRFSDVANLAKAPEDEVLSFWSGLGYYSRARNIHKTAKILDEQYQGQFPKELDLLIALPGIGPSTAAAILSQAFNLPTAILDANVKRVLTRYFRIAGEPESASIKKRLWELANTCMPKENCADYTQAIMDLGATCCTSKNPSCYQCPLQSGCLAFSHEEQHLYPTKKIKKPVPQVQEQFLVLSNQQGLVYLEKRPPTGLWGGLWCLPAIQEGESPLPFIKAKYGLDGKDCKELMTFKHSFSHFNLTIKAIHIQTHALTSQISETTGKWVNKAKLGSLGLAKPTTKILSEVFCE